DMCMCVRSICKVTFQLADLFLDVVPDCICYLNIFSSNFTSDHSETPPSMRYTSCFYYIRVFRLLKTLTHPRRQAFLCKFFQAPDVQSYRLYRYHPRPEPASLQALEQPDHP